ncbi:MAG: hypothetical protein AAFQ36_10160 [Pseudomonadota bacterium]
MKRLLKRLRVQRTRPAPPIVEEVLSESTALVPVPAEPTPRWHAPEGWVGALPAPHKPLALPFFPLLGAVIHLPTAVAAVEERKSTEPAPQIDVAAQEGPPPSGHAEMMQLALEAQQVIWLRMAGMAMPTPGQMQENHRMVAEKPPAFAQAMFDGTLALMTGHTPDEAARRTAARLRKVTSENIKRLTE